MGTYARTRLLAASSMAALIIGTTGAARAAGDQEFAMLAGEIQVSGTIRSLDRAHDSIRMDVSAVTLPNGNSTALNPPRPKLITVDDGTAIYVRGSQQQEVKFASLHAGVHAIVTGKDLGVGKALPARSIAVWDSRAGGVYHFGGGIQFALTGGEAPAPATAPLDAPPPANPLRALPAAPGTVWSVTFSPDGHLVATGGDVPKVVVDTGGDVTNAPVVVVNGGGLWNPDTGDLIHPVAAGETVYAVAFSPDNTLLATACSDGLVRLWNTQTGQLVKELGNPGRAVYTVAFFSGGGTIAGSTGDSTVKVWDARTGDLLKTLNSNSGKIGTVACGPGNMVVASGSGDSSLTIWNADTGEVKQTLQMGATPCPKIAFSPDGTTLAAGSRDGAVTLWDLNAGKALWTQKLHAGRITAIAFSSTGKTIATGGADRMIRLVDARDGTPLKGFAAHTGPVDSVAFSHDGALLASASSDRLVKFWKVD